MRRVRRDDGVILPFVALCLVAIVVVVAIVIDLGATRALRRDTRSAADAGATAGAFSTKDTTPVDVCIDALAYAFSTLGGTQPSSSSITGACSGLTNQASWLAESYQLAAQMSYVEGVAMYTSRDGVDGVSPYSLDSFGLLAHDYTPKPSYVSVRNEWVCLAAGTC